MFIFALKQIIMENKLISMVEFVLEYGDIRMNQHMSVQQLHNYANFLNTPLNLGMFVPAIEVDGEWEVLEHPKFNEMGSPLKTNKCTLEQYQQAKDKVIFEGVVEANSTNNVYQVYNSDNRFLFKKEDGSSYANAIIQNLIKYAPTLTKYGKQISGLNK